MHVWGGNNNVYRGSTHIFHVGGTPTTACANKWLCLSQVVPAWSTFAILLHKKMLCFFMCMCVWIFFSDQRLLNQLYLLYCTKIASFSHKTVKSIPLAIHKSVDYAFFWGGVLDPADVWEKLQVLGPQFKSMCLLFVVAAANDIASSGCLTIATFGSHACLAKGNSLQLCFSCLPETLHSELLLSVLHFSFKIEPMSIKKVKQSLLGFGLKHPSIQFICELIQKCKFTEHLQHIYTFSFAKNISRHSLITENVVLTNIQWSFEPPLWSLQWTQQSNFCTRYSSL